MVLLVPAVLQLLLLLAEAQPSVSAAERWANVLESAAEPTAAHTGGAQSLRLAEQLEPGGTRASQRRLAGAASVLWPAAAAWLDPAPRPRHKLDVRGDQGPPYAYA